MASSLEPIAMQRPLTRILPQSASPTAPSRRGPSPLLPPSGRGGARSAGGRARILPLLLITLTLALPAVAGSLSTRFTEVDMPNVPVGATVSPRLPDGTGYTLVNDSDRPLRVRMNAERPSFCEPVTPGPQYRPLPPSCKVSFDPQILDIAPHGTGAVLVAISIPGDPALAGRRFEVWLRAETLVGNAGVALVSRLRLSTAAQGAAVERGNVESGNVESGDAAERQGGVSHAEFAEAAEASAPPPPSVRGDAAERQGGGSHAESAPVGPDRRAGRSEEVSP